MFVPSVVQPWPYLGCEIWHSSGHSLHWFKRKQKFCCLKCLVGVASLNWIGKLLNNSNFLFPQKECIGKLILILFIHKVSETSWACRRWQCLNTYRFRILSWCCCVDQFVLFSCILLLFLISVLHWKPLQTQTSLCFWHCAHGRVVFPYEVLMTKTIIPKGHCGNLFRIPVVTYLWRLWTDLVWIAMNFRGEKKNLVVI